jgi:hypothetical protein
MGQEKEIFPPFLKAPKQCLLLSLVEVRLKEGKALGSEKVVLACEVGCDNRREVEPGLSIL